MTRYVDRPGPKHSAQGYPDQIARGCLESDWMYKSLPNKKGIYTWRKLEKIGHSGQRDTGLLHPLTHLRVVKHYVIGESGDEYVCNAHGMLELDQSHDKPEPLGETLT